MAKVQSEVWFRTDEIQEFIGALEFSARLLPFVAQNPSDWKWAIIALHNALQGACVCALRGADTAGISVLDKVSGKAMWHWLDVESRKPEYPPPPLEKLATTLDLYRRVKQSSYLPNPLPQNASRDWSVRKLNSLRNDFIHFVPKGLAIELSGMPKIVEHVRDVIDHLAIEFPTFDHHYKNADRQRIKASLLNLQVN